MHHHGSASRTLGRCPSSGLTVGVGRALHGIRVGHLIYVGFLCRSVGHCLVRATFLRLTDDPLHFLHDILEDLGVSLRPDEHTHLDVVRLREIVENSSTPARRPTRSCSTWRAVLVEVELHRCSASIQARSRSWSSSLP